MPICRGLLAGDVEVQMRPNAEPPSLPRMPTSCPILTLAPGAIAGRWCADGLATPAAFVEQVNDIVAYLGGLSSCPSERFARRNNDAVGGGDDFERSSTPPMSDRSDSVLVSEFSPHRRASVRWPSACRTRTSAGGGIGECTWFKQRFLGRQRRMRASLARPQGPSPAMPFAALARC